MSRAFVFIRAESLDQITMGGYVLQPIERRSSALACTGSYIMRGGSSFIQAKR